MNPEHKQLAAGKWAKMTFAEQMANVGSEVGRAINWREKGNGDFSQKAFERALELLDLTIADKKNRHRLREIVRVREALADFFAFGNIFQSSRESWARYFDSFNFLARANF